MTICQFIYNLKTFNEKEKYLWVLYVYERVKKIMFSLLLIWLYFNCVNLSNSESIYLVPARLRSPA